MAEVRRTPIVANAALIAVNIAANAAIASKSMAPIWAPLLAPYTKIEACAILNFMNYIYESTGGIEEQREIVEGVDYVMHQKCCITWR